MYLQHVYVAKGLFIELYPKMLSTSHIARFFGSAIFSEAIASSAIFKFVSTLHSHQKCPKMLLNFGTVKYFKFIQFSWIFLIFYIVKTVRFQFLNSWFQLLHFINITISIFSTRCHNYLNSLMLLLYCNFLFSQFVFSC